MSYSTYEYLATQSIEPRQINIGDGTNFNAILGANGVSLGGTQNGEVTTYGMNNSYEYVSHNGYMIENGVSAVYLEKDSASTSSETIVNVKSLPAYTSQSGVTYSAGGASVPVDRNDALQYVLQANGINMTNDVSPETIEQIWEYVRKNNEGKQPGDDGYTSFLDSINEILGTSDVPLPPLINTRVPVLSNYEYIMKGGDDALQGKRVMFMRGKDVQALLKACAQAGIFNFSDVLDDDYETKVLMRSKGAGDYIELKPVGEMEYNDELLPENAFEFFINITLYQTALEKRAMPTPEQFENSYIVSSEGGISIPEYVSTLVENENGQRANFFANFAEHSYLWNIGTLGFYLPSGNQVQIAENYPLRGYAILNRDGFPDGTFFTNNYHKQWYNERWSGIGTAGKPHYRENSFVFVYDKEDFLTYIVQANEEGTLDHLDECAILFANATKVKQSGVPGFVGGNNTLKGINSESTISDIDNAINNQYSSWVSNAYNVTKYDPVTNQNYTETYYPVTNYITNNYEEAQSGRVNVADEDGFWDKLKDKLKFVFDVTMPGNIYPIIDWNLDLLFGGKTNAMYSIYNPTQAQVDTMGKFFWSTSFLEIIKRFFTNPLDAIISLHLVYFTPHHTNQGQMILGYCEVEGTDMDKVNLVDEQFAEVDCGTVTIPKFYDDVRDWSPYTDIQIYLPFIGIQSLDCNEVMGKMIGVKYYVDVITGLCMCVISVYEGASRKILYTFSGDCHVSIPLTSSNLANMLSGFASGLVSGATKGGAIGGAIGAVTGAVQQGLSYPRSNGFSGNTGAMGTKTPYVIIKRKEKYDANEYNKLYGYPSNNTVSLGVLSGYTRCKDVHFESAKATDKEKAQMETLLKNGVIL